MEGKASDYLEVTLRLVRLTPCKQPQSWVKGTGQPVSSAAPNVGPTFHFGELRRQMLQEAALWLSHSFLAEQFWDARFKTPQSEGGWP